MTEQEFEKVIRKKQGSNLINYLVCGFITVLGLLMLAVPLVEPAPILFGLFFSAFGIYCLWRIQKKYKINVIVSDKPEAAKFAVVAQYFSKVQKVHQNNNNFYSASYHIKNWSANRFEINVHFDDNQLLFNVAPIAARIIDFGATKKETRRAAQYFTERL